MPIELHDPSIEVLDRIRSIETMDVSSAPITDVLELAEREEAAIAYAGESEGHFVDYLFDCLKTSRDMTRDIREVQAECYRVYQESEPHNYDNKSDWQSRITVPKPFATVEFGAAAVKKAFSPNFLSINDEASPEVQEFWRKMMHVHLDEMHASFVQSFTDAVRMALAVGVSMEMIPQWIPGRGLRFSLVEPWKITRDHDAPPRQPDGGMYWIHTEWMDLWELRKGESDGRYRNTSKIGASENPDPNDPLMTLEAIARRKGQVHKRSEFRTAAMVHEFWGIILDKKGNMLLPSATYTVAGGHIIQLPSAVQYSRVRWPGVSFSPLPGLLSHGGRGLLEGVRSIWYAMNDLMCLHQDALNWLVNPPMEICAEDLVDPEDVESWPGKKYLVRSTVNGQQVVREVTRRDRTSSILANMQYHDQNFQRGSFVTDAVQGLPGYRKDMTYREASMNLDQAMGVYGLMGGSIEQGAIWALTAAYDTIRSFAGYSDYQAAVGDELCNMLGVGVTQGGETTPPPDLSGRFHVSGMQALMRDHDTLAAIKETVIPLAQSGRFAPYIQGYNVLKSIERRVNLDDEHVFVPENIGLAIQQAQFNQMTGNGQPQQPQQNNDQKPQPPHAAAQESNAPSHNRMPQQ